MDLDPALLSTSEPVCELALCAVRLQSDSRFPWLVLVPRRAYVSELHELAHAERMVLIEEIARAARALKTATGAAKINVGALGNIVPQLHVHVVARKTDDPAWPGPVWGCGAREPYGEKRITATVARLKGEL